LAKDQTKSDNKPAQRPGQTLGKAQEPRKKSKLGGLIIVLLILVLLAGTTVFYLYNFFDFKTMVIGFFISQDSTYVDKLADLDERKASIEKQYKIADESEKFLREQIEGLKSREQSLIRREEALKQQTDDLHASIASYENDVLEFERVMDTIRSMDNGAAAAMIQKMTNVGQMARVISNMEPKKAGGILSALPPELAASITERLMQLSGRS
jgi:flagellar motility protein MotE (MotC chaperone)